MTTFNLQCTASSYKYVIMTKLQQHLWFTYRPVCIVYDTYVVHLKLWYFCSRLILIAEKDKVYDKFPIPLINRLEKHLVTTSTILLPDQQEVLQLLEQWIDGFTEVQGYITDASVSPASFCINSTTFGSLHYTAHQLFSSVLIDLRKVMHLLVFSHKLQPLWFSKQVSLSVMHYMILGMTTWVVDVS